MAKIINTAFGQIGGVEKVNGKEGEVQLSAADVGAVATTAVGKPGGVASLDATGIVPLNQLPPIDDSSHAKLADKATALAIGRTIGPVDLASDASPLFDGTQNITIGAKGPLPAAKGGITPNRTLQVNLASTAVTTDNGGNLTIGRTGILDIDGGGTGKSTAAEGLAALGGLPASQRGTANGVASLDGTGHVPAEQLPSYVDAVQPFNSLSLFPPTGVDSVIYVAKDSRKIYRWAGAGVGEGPSNGYIEISPTAGTADAAIQLATSRTIGGVQFDGTKDIDLPGVNKAGTQDTSGTAAKAAALATSRAIGGVQFNGTADINLPGVNQAGTQNTSGTAAKADTLTTALSKQLGGTGHQNGAVYSLDFDFLALATGGLPANPSSRGLYIVP